MDTGSGLFEIETDPVKQQKFETDIRHIEPERGRKRPKDKMDVSAIRIFGCYAECRADRVGHRALAHLLAAHSIPIPKQAKEPTFLPATKDELVTDD